ncbi:cysteine-rich receptor-like protein kinase 8 [Artemisia annua]|uniref:Cysteine-rich receptor-like protein kinase 8 n=1 Tax=Artemisia annua TaxID=35608 RepID=A0A2U1LY18_ARTAN|nr:cysteine-rich receptor-like protein kinase 8 [Artemisia annua]
MVNQNSILFFLVTIISLFTFSVTQERLRCDNNSANFTINGIYQRNLNDALSSLTSDTSIRYGFYNQSVGQIPDQVNTLALCRVDVQPNDCRSCINTTSARLRAACPNKKAAIANPNNVSNVAQYNQVLYQLLDQLRSDASRGGSLRKYAANSTNALAFTTINGFMQCTPDLSRTQCYNCLDLAIRLIPICCDSKSSNTRTVVIAVVAGVSLILLLVTSVIVFMRRKRKTHGRLPENLDSSLFYIDFPCSNSFVFRHGKVGEMELRQL